MTGTKISMALCACFLTLTCHAKEPQMSDVKTYCVGRYLVDLPADALINGEAYQYDYGRIDSSSLSQADFLKRMEQREADLKAGKQRDGYALTGTRRPSATIRTFELAKQLLTGPSTGFEAYRWDRDRVFSMEETAYKPAKLPQVLAGLEENVLSKLEFRKQDDAPLQPGFCLKDGFIANDGKTPQFEDAGISFEFSQWPGVLVSIETITVTKPGEPTLFQRADSGSVPAMFIDLVSRIKTLRRGQREINGRHGEEILETVPTDGGYRLHQFRWEAQGAGVRDPLNPTLTVEFESGMKRDDTGQPARPRLTDAEAIAVFDAVASSLRLRPTSGPKVSEVEPTPALPLGTLAQSGSPCPQTGWWTCPEASVHPIEGGARQHVDAGTVMPVAQVLGKPGFIDRMSGSQPKYPVHTTWQLVAYDAGAGDSGPAATQK